jgi:type I restriction enzyme S subunit
MNMRRHKPYPAYKESGVECLGSIPEHWNIKRLKYAALLNQDALSEETDPALDMIYVDIGGVDSLGRIIEQQELTFAKAPSRARRLVRHGDVIVSTVRTYLRAIALIMHPQPTTVVSTGFAVIRPGIDLNAKYASYALRSPYFVERVVAYSNGVSFPAINEGEMAAFEIAVPPDSEQHAIVHFLDREIERIDSLIAKNERLIKLLQEKREVVITHAVTKGLDPTAPMKDSGIEWMGKIPAHWSIQKMKHVCDRIFVGIAEAATFAYVDDGVPMLRSTDVRENRIRADDIREIDRDFAKRLVSKRLRASDIVTVRTGNAGVSAVVPGDYDGGQCFTLVVSRPRNCQVGQYFSYLLNSPIGQWQFSIDGMGTAQVNISVPIVQNLIVCVPSLDDQKAIARYLESEIQHGDMLLCKLQNGIDGLKELRSALISAAVTGQIDVREYAA